jgi:hypothetical protein
MFRLTELEFQQREIDKRHNMAKVAYNNALDNLGRKLCYCIGPDNCNDFNCKLVKDRKHNHV